MKKYQVYITSDDRGKMNRFSFSSSHIRFLIGFCVFVLVALSVLIVDYSLSVSQKAELDHLRVENSKLNDYVDNVKDQVRELELDIQKIEDFSFKLKTITNSRSDKSRSPNSFRGIGPLPNHYYYNDHRVAPSMMQDSSFDNTPNLLAPDDDNQSLNQSLNKLKKRGSILLSDIWHTLGVLEENKHLLRVTPSVWPTQGWVTSRFGYRDYPAMAGGDGFASSDLSVADFHGGLDIAAAIGTRIVAPADGLIVSTGTDRRTGNYIVINHGYDLKTLYGHLHRVNVKAHQKVKRGDVIGTVGNTGRSTGPHLHYEVRISNKAVNPEHYILN